VIVIKSPEEIEGIKEASKIVADVFEHIKDFVVEGVTTREIDREIDRFIRKRGARPAFLGYRGFPASSCISLNSEVVHGIPSDRRLRYGDLVKIDIGVERKGFIGDSARTFVVGEVPSRVKELLEATQIALKRGIEMCYPGNRISDISHSIEMVAKNYGFSVVKELGGHGVGLALHEEPVIYNYGPAGQGPVIKRGMVLAIEPMLNLGKADILIRKDGWTVVTKDGSPSAHFEHTVLVTDNSPEVLTDPEYILSVKDTEH